MSVKLKHHQGEQRPFFYRNKDAIQVVLGALDLKDSNNPLFHVKNIHIYNYNE